MSDFQRQSETGEHLCACPNCGLSVAVPCAGEIVADVRTSGITWFDPKLYEREHPKMAALIRRVIRDNMPALRRLAEYDGPAAKREAGQ